MKASRNHERLRPYVVIPMCALFCTAVSGCQLLYFFVSQKKEQVQAEFGQLAGERIAVVVWAEPATLDLDPFARHRVGKSVRYHMLKGMPDTYFVDTRDVDEMQERIGSRWESWSHQRICEHLQCDWIVWIDLMAYTTRLQDARALRKGRIEATVNVFAGSDDMGVESRYDDEISVTFPERSTADTINMSDSDILHNTVELFAQIVARKFYNHERPYTRKNVS